MLTRFLLGAALLFTSGCSFVLVNGPPGNIPANEPVPVLSCTTERTFPFLDAAGTAIAVAAVLWASEGDAVRYGAVGGAALGFSSYTGFRRVNQCRARVLPSVDTLFTDALVPGTPFEIADPLPAAPQPGPRRHGPPLLPGSGMR